MGSGKTLFRVVLFNSRSQISRITDVEPRVGFRSEHVNVEHLGSATVAPGTLAKPLRAGSALKRKHSSRPRDG